MSIINKYRGLISNPNFNDMNTVSLISINHHHNQQNRRPVAEPNIHGRRW